MKSYSLVVCIAVLLFPFCMQAQHCQTDWQDDAPGVPTKQELLKSIDRYQASLRQAEAAHASDAVKGQVYSKLGLIYEDLTMFDQAEASFQHAVQLFQHDAQEQCPLSAAFSNLGRIYVQKRDFHHAEKEQLEALHIREHLGDKRAVAISWNELSLLYFEKHDYARAKSYAEQSIAVFRDDQEAAAVDKMSALFVLAKSTCALNNCSAAIPLLKDAMTLAKQIFQPTDFPLGLGYFSLGYAYWKSGLLPEAAENMKEGVTILGYQLQWGHPIYRNSLKQYAQFLHETHHEQEAKVVQNQLLQLDSVVDARMMTQAQLR